jgi:hypothetical protein
MPQETATPQHEDFRSTELQGTSPMPQLIELSGQQRALYEALTFRSPALADMYIGALHVLNSDNPVRFSLAGHSFRELMDKSARYFDIPVKERPVFLKSKVISFSEHWQACSKKTECYTNGDWEGQIDPHMRKFLINAAKFFEWFSSQFEVRKERTTTLLRALDPLQRPLPGPIETLRVSEWDACHDFFVSVAHHGTVDGFEAWQDAFERFLLDTLQPRTYSDRALIDSIIQEGEVDA